MRLNSEALVNAFIFFTWVALIYSIYHDYIENVMWRIIVWVSLLLLSTGLYFWFTHMSHWTNFIVSLTILASIFGEIIFEFYYSIPIYDKILHFTVPFAIVVIAFDGLRPLFPDLKKRLLYSFYITLIICFSWEIIEIVFDYFFDAPMIGVFIKQPVPGALSESMAIMNPMKDTTYDVILDIVGSFLAMKFLQRKNKIP